MVATFVQLLCVGRLSKFYVTGVGSCWQCGWQATSLLHAHQLVRTMHIHSTLCHSARFRIALLHLARIASVAQIYLHVSLLLHTVGAVSILS